MHQLYKVNKWEDFNSDEEKRGTVKFLNFGTPLPKIQTRRPNLWVFYQNDANDIANSGDPDQTAPLRAV